MTFLVFIHSFSDDCESRFLFCLLRFFHITLSKEEESKQTGRHVLLRALTIVYLEFHYRYCVASAKLCISWLLFILLQMSFKDVSLFVH